MLSTFLLRDRAPSWQAGRGSRHVFDSLVHPPLGVGRRQRVVNYHRIWSNRQSSAGPPRPRDMTAREPVHLPVPRAAHLTGITIADIADIAVSPECRASVIDPNSSVPDTTTTLP